MCFMLICAQLASHMYSHQQHVQVAQCRRKVHAGYVLYRALVLYMSLD